MYINDKNDSINALTVFSFFFYFTNVFATHVTSSAGECIQNKLT